MTEKLKCRYCESSNIVSGALGYRCKDCGLSEGTFHITKGNAKKTIPLSKREEEMYGTLYNAMETLRSAAHGYTEECDDEADKILDLLRRMDEDYEKKHDVPINKILKPCPFCGSEAHLLVQCMDGRREYSVKCSGCGIKSKPNTIPELITFWNTRSH